MHVRLAQAYITKGGIAYPAALTHANTVTRDLLSDVTVNTCFWPLPSLISFHADTAEIQGNAQTERQMDKQTAF